MEHLEEGWKGSPPANAPSNPSWYTMFAKVASASFKEIAYLRLGCQTTGGKTQKYTSDAGMQFVFTNFDHYSDPRR